jgi:mono/diheme cytochrome c family protein
VKKLAVLSLIVPAVLSNAAGTNDLTVDDIAAARKIYVAKCAKCHRFYEPTNYGEADWDRWMEKMATKSKLKEDQAKLLNRYLAAYRAGQLPGKPEQRPAPGGRR